MTYQQDTHNQSLLLPVFLLSLAFAGSMLSQTFMLSSDHGTLRTAYDNQAKMLEQVEKVKTQVNALAKGVLDLSRQGNKNAQGIIEDLKRAGVNVQEPQQTATPSTPPAPAAQ